jgi:lysophospholipid acyltransferase (LPLAT)-like uncharacterized protein
MKKKLKKQIKYSIATKILKVYSAFLEKTANRTVIGQQIIDQFIMSEKPCLLCFWHQHIMMTVLYLLDWQRQGLKSGFLISPSGDGSLAARLFVRDGVTLISGSSGRTGSQTMRKLMLALKRDKLSLAITPDGPRGPLYDFKPGPLMLASMTGAPIVPVATACSNYWQLKSWDRFIMPKWFSNITAVVGEPVYIEPDLPLRALRPKCQQLHDALMNAKQQAEEHIKNSNYENR